MGTTAATPTVDTALSALAAARKNLATTSANQKSAQATRDAATNAAAQADEDQAAAAAATKSAASDAIAALTDLENSL